MIDAYKKRQNFIVQSTAKGVNQRLPLAIETKGAGKSNLKITLDL